MTMHASLALAIPDDIPTVVLALGLIASLITTVAMILGRTPSKKQSAYVQAPKQAQMPAWTPVPTANSARERASAAARIKAAASVRERGLHLTDVHEVDSVEIDPADLGPYVSYDGYDPATNDLKCLSIVNACTVLPKPISSASMPPQPTSFK